MQISKCKECKDFFLGSMLLKVEIAHELRKFGKNAAEALLLELLAEEHAGHK